MRCVEKVCAVISANEEVLNELDRGAGDGDCGSTLKAGADGKKRKFHTQSFNLKQEPSLWAPI